MQLSWESLAAILESPPGSTVYTLLVLLLLSGLSLWLQNRLAGAFSSGMGRVFGALMILRLLQSLAAGAAWWGAPSMAWALPALERGLHLISLVALAWLWAGQPRSRWLAAGLLGAAALAAWLLAARMGMPDGASFNYSTLDYVWSVACLLVLAVAAWLVWRSRSSAGLGTIVLLVLGQVLHMLLAEPFGDMPLITKAAQLLSLPLLARLPAASARPEAAAEEGTTGEMQEYVPGPFELNIDEEEEAEELAPVPAPLNPNELAKHVAGAFKADLCIFAQLEHEADELQLAAGYNVLRDLAIEPASVPLAGMPRLKEALLAGQPLSLSVEDNAEELTVFSQALRLSFPAFLLAQPLPELESPQPWAALLLNLTEPWQQEEQLALQQDALELSAQLAESLEIPLTATMLPEMPPLAQPSELLGLQSRLEALSSENERYRADVERLLAHIDQLQAGAAPESPQALQSNELVHALQMENERLKQSLASLAASQAAPAGEGDPDGRQAREELRLALQEIAELHEQLAQAQQAALLPISTPGATISSNQMGVIASIAQELRQPLSSVVGYTDLLLGESVGILGALQRKFLERVRHSTERMNTLIDNLIRIAELDEGGYSAQRKPVELGGVIDDAVGQLRPQLQEKRIALRVDLPEHLPELNTDRDALQQILYHLLQNADAATPAAGEITLRAFVDSQPELGDFALIQVSDSGGGIPEDELPRVFSRVYRASNPVIPGVGDTGVGLTIAETLTQALGGRIWVETEPGVGATFSILLPLNPEQIPQ